MEAYFEPAVHIYVHISEPHLRFYYAYRKNMHLYLKDIYKQNPDYFMFDFNGNSSKSSDQRFFKTSFNLIEWLLKDQIFAKFNLDIVSPPPYEREILHYQKVNIDLITRAINSFDWEKAFSNIYFDKMAFISNQTIINILCNFISLILF